MRKRRWTALRWPDESVDQGAGRDHDPAPVQEDVAPFARGRAAAGKPEGRNEEKPGHAVDDAAVGGAGTEGTTVYGDLLLCIFMQGRSNGKDPAVLLIIASGQEAFKENGKSIFLLRNCAKICKKIKFKIKHGLIRPSLSIVREKSCVMMLSLRKRGMIWQVRSGDHDDLNRAGEKSRPWR